MFGRFQMPREVLTEERRQASGSTVGIPGKVQERTEQGNQRLADQVQGNEAGTHSGVWRDGVTERRDLWKSSMGFT